ncbi:MAG TPA: hypothetical protein VFK10_01085 [Burkholderiaceae bacterium]|nr:hypothetical protein [Burkholderiaceae bacterium]
MVERLYPGVYVSEVPFSAKPIEGVSVSSAPMQTSAQREPMLPATPDWTQHNQHDPGITFAQLFSWVGDLELFRTPMPADRQAAYALAAWGVAAGLAVDAGDGTTGVNLAPGYASGVDGQPIVVDSPTAAHRIRKP